MMDATEYVKAQEQLIHDLADKPELFDKLTIIMDKMFGYLTQKTMELQNTQAAPTPRVTRAHSCQDHGGWICQTPTNPIDTEFLECLYSLNDDDKTELKRRAYKNRISESQQKLEKLTPTPPR